MKPGGGGAQGGNVGDIVGVRRGMWGDTETGGDVEGRGREKRGHWDTRARRRGTGGDVEGLGEEKKGRRGLLPGGG